MKHLKPISEFFTLSEQLFGSAVRKFNKEIFGVEDTQPQSQSQSTPQTSTSTSGAQGAATSWSDDPSFFTDSKGKNLLTLASGSGISLTRKKGLNGSFDKAKYNSSKNNSKVYWAVYDITANKLLASSSNASSNVYGASVPKVCVASAAFSVNKGVLPSDSDYGKVIKLLVNSDNTVWDDVGKLAGGDNAVNDWASAMGYKMKPGRRAGNQSNALDMCKFWSDVCQGKFPGADTIFRITSACNTGKSRSLKCMPSDVYMGGKTGSYKNVNHDTCWIQRGNNFYSISVLTELGSAGSSVIAHMFRGLYDEYCK